MKVHAQLHQDGEWWVAFCSEFPEANGQGTTESECLESLLAAIRLLLEDRAADARSLASRGQRVEVLELA